jgi:hypothetical protein
MEYAALGWRVVLCHGLIERDGKPACTCGQGANCATPGKHPRLVGWKELATSDEEAIAEQLQRHPVSNLGLKLGPGSGLADIEFDCDEGRQTAERLLAGSFTPTYVSGRSTHRLYRFPSGVTVPKKASVTVQGLEVRLGNDAKGAQSVAPPSVHASGVNYRYATGLGPSDVECEPFPEALVELLAGQAGGNGNGQGDGFTMEGHFWESPGAKEGERNAMLLRMAGRYVASYGCQDYDNLLSHALAWNERCKPAKPAADIDKSLRWLWDKELAKRAATPRADATQPANGNGQAMRAAKPRLVTRKYSAIESKPIAWLWEGKIPRGMVTILAGLGGWGKSTVATDLAARLSTGSPWPDGSPCAVGDALLVSAEESAEYTVKARLEALGADCQRIHDLAYVQANGEERPVTLPGDAGILREMLAELPEAKLLIIDTIADVLGAIDENKNLMVRRALVPLKRLAEEFALAVVAIAHVGKAKDVSADVKILGSVAFTNLARCTWHIGGDPDDTEADRKLRRRLWLPGKANIPLGNGLAFHTEWTGQAVVPRWELGEVFGDADLLYKSQPWAKESKAGEVADFLSAALANGPRLPGDVVKQGEALGLARRTLYRVAKEMGWIGEAGLWRIPKADAYTF